MGFLMEEGKIEGHRAGIGPGNRSFRGGGRQKGVGENNRIALWLLYGRRLENEGCGNNRIASWLVAGGFDLFPMWRVIYPVDGFRLRRGR